MKMILFRVCLRLLTHYTVLWPCVVCAVHVCIQWWFGFYLIRFISQAHTWFYSLFPFWFRFLFTISFLYKNVSCVIDIPHLFSLNIILCVGDEPLCMIALLLPCCGRRIVDMKLVSQAFVAMDIPKRWWVCWFGLQHK